MERPKTSTARKTSATTNVWVTELYLTKYDKQALLDPVGWLTDTIVNAAQTLLRQQLPHIQSLQSVAKGMTMSFCIQNGKFLQILHSNGHWFTVCRESLSNVTVQVYDSLYSTVPTLGKAQIACLLNTPEEQIEVQIMDVQQQVCGYKIDKKLIKCCMCMLS